MKIVSLAKRRKSLSALGLVPFPDLTGWEGVQVETPRPKKGPDGALRPPAGDPKILLDADLCLRKGLRAGQALSEEALAELVAESARARAKSKALWLLSRRDYGEKELAGKLEREFGQEAAAYAARRMAETGLVNDAAYAQRLASQLLEGRKVSARQAVYQITAKGIDRDLAEAAVAGFSPDPKAQIRAVIQQKYSRCLSDEKGVRRTVAGLARRGFSFGDIREVLREWADAYDYNEDE